MIAFLTGGTGFVGSHLAEELLARGYQVRAMVRSDPKWLKGLDVELVKGDLFDTAMIRQALEGVDRVFHVAGLTRARTQEELDRANVEGTLRLLEAVRQTPGVRQTLITSSLAAVGPCSRPPAPATPLSEVDRLQPISRYGESKARMEVALAEEFEDLPITIVRPPAVYGPREADIFTVIRTAARQRIFPIVGRGEVPQMSLVHVRDLVRGMADAGEHEEAAGETFFISSEKDYSWNEIADAVEVALGQRLYRIRVPHGIVTPVGAVVETLGAAMGVYPALNREKARESAETWLCSVDKARQMLGYRQQISLEEGMTETVRWYRENGWL